MRSGRHSRDLLCTARSRQAKGRGKERKETYTIDRPSRFDIGQTVGLRVNHPKLRMRLENLHDEYLFYGGIRAERILAVIPAMGDPYNLDVYLGVLTLPESCWHAIGTEGVDEAVRTIIAREESASATWGMGRGPISISVHRSNNIEPYKLDRFSSPDDFRLYISSYSIPRKHPPEA